MAAHSRSAQRCAALRAQRSTFCCVKRAEENEINHIQARRVRGDGGRERGSEPKAQSKRLASRSGGGGSAVGKKFSVKRRAY